MILEKHHRRRHNTLTDYPMRPIMQQWGTFTTTCKCVLDATCLNNFAAYDYSDFFPTCCTSGQAKCLSAGRYRVQLKTPHSPYGNICMINTACVHTVHSPCNQCLLWLIQPLAGGTISISFLRSVLVPSSALSFLTVHDHLSFWLSKLLNLLRCY